MLWCSCGVAVSMGEAAKPFMFEGFQRDSNVVLRGRRGTSWHFDVSAKVSNVVLCDKRDTFARFSEDELNSRGRRSTLDTSIMILCGRCSTLDACFCVFFANRIVRAGWRGDNVQIARQAYDIVSVSFWVAWAVFGPDPLCVECHFAWQAQYFGHSALYTPHSKLDKPHSTLYTLFFTLHTPHFMLYTPHSTRHTLHFTLYTLDSALHTLHSTLSTSHSALYTLHSTLHTLHVTLFTPHSTLYTLPSTLYTLHSTLYTPRLTL